MFYHQSQEILNFLSKNSGFHKLEILDENHEILMQSNAPNYAIKYPGKQEQNAPNWKWNAPALIKNERMLLNLLVETLLK